MLAGSVAVRGRWWLCVPVLGVAALLGSGPPELWDALVVFRAEASAVLAASATADTAQRLVILVAALVATALPLVVLAVVAGPADPRPHHRSRLSSGLDATGPTAQLTTDLRLPGRHGAGLGTPRRVVGGSYWLHYLVALLPGVALLVGVGLQRRPSLGRGFRRRAIARGVDLDHRHHCRQRHPSRAGPRARRLSTTSVPMPTQATPVSSRSERRTFSTRAAGLTSPYPQPVEPPGPSPRPPAARPAQPSWPGRTVLNWLVVVGSSIATWGVDEGAAQPLVERYYTHRAAAGDFQIYSLAEETP